jgi:hypothetical protein
VGFVVPNLWVKKNPIGFYTNKIVGEEKPYTVWYAEVWGMANYV